MLPILGWVSSVPEWQKGIKWLIDGDKLKNCTVMATGSQAINIRNAAERLPGRRGRVADNYDKILLPMKFAEYASVASSDINDLVMENHVPALDHRKDIFMKLLSGEIGETLDTFCACQNELGGLLEEYMLAGGTPRVVDEKIKAPAIGESLYTSHLEGITGEWNALSKSETMLKQFCGAVIKSQGSHTSWNNLSKEADLGSPNTALGYAHALKDLFVLSTICRYGGGRKIPMARSDRKIYFSDPYFLHIFNGLISTDGSFDASLEYVHDEGNRGKIVEGIMADHLNGWAFALSDKKQTFDHSNHVFYWKDEKKGRWTLSCLK